MVKLYDFNGLEKLKKEIYKFSTQFLIFYSIRTSILPTTEKLKSAIFHQLSNRLYTIASNFLFSNFIGYS